MNIFDPEKLSVEFREGVTATEPVIPRRYTLTHSDETAQLFLTIGKEYAKDQITVMRDEVLGEWAENKGNYLYYVYLYIDGELGQGKARIRNYVFRRELGLALTAIRYGDGQFFQEHAELNNAPIFVFFLSSDPQYNKVESWGVFSDYQIK